MLTISESHLSVIVSFYNVEMAMLMDDSRYLKPRDAENNGKFIEICSLDIKNKGRVALERDIIDQSKFYLQAGKKVYQLDFVW